MDWVRGDSIGHGSFGTVNFALPRRQGSQFPPVMAVKSCDASLHASLMNEKPILDELRGCPEIVHCFGDGFSNEKGGRFYNILLEYAAGGDLGEKLKNDQRFTESEVRRYTKSVLKGLHVVHNKGFVHCDIKLQNLLLFPSQKGKDEVKIADFGLAKRIGENEARLRASEIRGTPMYMSPEMVAGGEQDSPVDIWALGCIVVEMLTGSPVWRCTSSKEVAALLMRIGVGDEVPEIPAKLSEEGKDFLGKCFARDPRKRWTAETLLNHPFIADRLDGDNDCTVEVEVSQVSTSPRSLFDFPDSVSSMACSTTTSSLLSLAPVVTSSKSAAEVRMRQLVSNEVDDEHDWSVSTTWVTVR